jgi:hypothetical protein
MMERGAAARAASDARDKHRMVCIAREKSVLIIPAGFDCRARIMFGGWGKADDAQLKNVA